MSGAREWAAIAYFALAGTGAVVPLSAFLPWLAVHGADPAGFVADLFSTRIGAFFGWDVIVAAVVTILFVAIEGRRARVAGRWWAVAATCCIGVSCGLPLFLGLRERALARASE